MSRAVRLCFILSTGSMAMAVVAAPTFLTTPDASLACLAFAAVGVALLTGRA